jgi:hypothetical protein
MYSAWKQAGYASTARVLAARAFSLKIRQKAVPQIPATLQTFARLTQDF